MWEGTEKSFEQVEQVDFWVAIEAEIGTFFGPTQEAPPTPEPLEGGFCV